MQISDPSPKTFGFKKKHLLLGVHCLLCCPPLSLVICQLLFFSYCLIAFYLSFSGAVIFCNWEGWTFAEGFYFSFITLSTIGFGDFVPGDATLGANSEDGTAQLSMACLYVVVGLALVSMAINLMQDTIRNKVIELAMDLGIIDDPSLDEDED